MKEINVIIVDDHQIIRDGIKAMFMTNNNIEVIGEAGDYDELMQLLRSDIPDVIILDITLPGKSGVEITAELKNKNPETKILILSSNTDEDNIVRAIQAGANGFLPKDTSKEEFIEAINLVNANEEYFGANLSKIIYKSYMHHVKTKNDAKPDVELSEREVEIVQMLSDGLSSKEIGCKLFISPRTVESHKANILDKLNLKNNAEIIKYAIKQGIVKL